MSFPPVKPIPLLDGRSVVVPEISRPEDPSWCLIRADSAAHMAALVGASGFGIITALRADTTLKRTVETIRASAPRAHLLLILRHLDGGRPFLGAHGRRIDIALVTDGERAVRNAVRRGWFEGRRERLERTLAASSIPPVLRAAGRTVLRQRLAAGPDKPPALTVRRIAALVGASPHYLSRGGRDHRLPVAELGRWWGLALALEARFFGGWTWEKIAFSMGYSGLPGLSESCHRHLDRRLRRVNTGDLYRSVAHVERVVVAAADGVHSP